MKVGVVCPYDLLAPGGVQQLCIELADLIREGGDDCVVVGPGRLDSKSPEGAVPVGATIGVRANDSVAPVAITPKAWRRMKNALEGVDVVHIHEPLVPLAGWAALSVDKPKVLTFHADAPDWVGVAYKTMPWLGRAIGDSILTAVSPSAARSIPDSWGVLRIIPNAINVSAFKVEVERMSKRIAFLGRDEPRKGLDVALEAFAQVRVVHPDSELIVIGAERAGTAPPGVSYKGFVTGSEKARLLASSSVYVAPNTGGESFGIVLAEAMAAGCAVVASDLEAFRAVVGSEARFVPVGHVAGFAGEIAELLADPEGCRRLGNAGRARVQRFDWSHVFDEYRSAYEDAIAGG